MDWLVMGLWVGLQAGSLFSCIFYCLILGLVSWEEIALEAEKRETENRASFSIENAGQQEEQEQLL